MLPRQSASIRTNPNWSYGWKRPAVTVAYRSQILMMKKALPTGATSSNQSSRRTTPVAADNRVRRINAVLQHPDPKLNWMLANVDREVIGASDVQILECKTAGINGARLWKEGVPVYVQLQVMHQLAVTGKQAADVAVLLGGQQLEIHRIERDDGLITRLIELEQDFWDYVQRDTPPAADGSESAAQALRCLYPEDNGNTRDFSQDPILCAAFDELKEARACLEIHSKREAELKQFLQQAMGDASRAVFANGSVTWRKAKDSLALDVPLLLKEKPYLLTRFSTTKPGSRRFLVT